MTRVRIEIEIGGGAAERGDNDGGDGGDGGSDSNGGSDGNGGGGDDDDDESTYILLDDGEQFGECGAGDNSGDATRRTHADSSAEFFSTALDGGSAAASANSLFLKSQLSKLPTCASAPVPVPVPVQQSSSESGLGRGVAALFGLIVESWSHR